MDRITPVRQALSFSAWLLMALALQVTAWTLATASRHFEHAILTGFMIGSASLLINFCLTTGIGVALADRPTRASVIKAVVDSGRRVSIATLSVLYPLLLWVDYYRRDPAILWFWIMYAPSAAFGLWALLRQRSRAALG